MQILLLSFAPPWLLPLGIALAVLLALWLTLLFLNWYVDPARIYRRRHEVRPARKLRERKLKLLREAKQPIATLILGTSRVFNLDLLGCLERERQAESSKAAGDGPARAASGKPSAEFIPSPQFNFAVDGGMSEDWLAAWRWVCRLNAQKGGGPPRLLIIGVGLPSFHPCKPLPWEALVERDFGQELVALGALPAGDFWRWPLLLRYDTARHTLRYLQKRARRKRDGYSAKFDYREDGVLHWLDQDKAGGGGLLERQLRSYPRTGLLLQSFERIGDRRGAWFEALLAECASAGTRVCICIVPEHPRMFEREQELGAKRVHDMVHSYLEQHCAASGALLLDWLDPASIGFDEACFRDIMHFTEPGARRLGSALLQALAAWRDS
ncbi:hypothetical protein IT575_14090 [bacterium]|nr:hypothetical protein [bacterium]